MNTNTKTIVALAAVVAISAILVASAITEDAMAKRCRRHSGGGGGGGGGDTHQTSAQANVGCSGQCQNVNSQNSGHDIASNTIGQQND